jgi:hypothetical protein
VVLAQNVQSTAGYSPIDGVVLDSDYLNRATFGDKPLRTEIVGLFLAQVNGLARNLGLPMDGQAWHFFTHTLKGAGSAVGAHYIHGLAKAWEEQPAPSSADSRAAYAIELQAAILAFEQAAAQLH